MKLVVEKNVYILYNTSKLKDGSSKMVSSSIVNADNQSIAGVFNKYNNAVNNLTETIWNGLSKENFVNLAFAFVSEFSDPISQQLQLLSVTTELYQEYIQKKESKNIAQSNYDTAIIDNNSEKIAQYSNQIKLFSQEVENLKQRIEANINEIIKYKIKTETKYDFINYYQYNYKNSFDYGETISSAGCGPTSMAMVLTYLTGEKIEPPTTAEYALNSSHRYRVKGNGISWEYFNAISKEYKIDCKQTGVTGKNIVDSLNNGETIIMSMKPGHFTANGHFIVLNGITDQGKIKVADPNSEIRSKQEWDLNVFEVEGAQMWSFK